MFIYHISYTFCCYLVINYKHIINKCTVHGINMSPIKDLSTLLSNGGERIQRGLTNVRARACFYVPRSTRRYSAVSRYANLQELLF